MRRHLSELKPWREAFINPAILFHQRQINVGHQSPRFLLVRVDFLSTALLFALLVLEFLPRMSGISPVWPILVCALLACSLSEGDKIRTLQVISVNYFYLKDNNQRLMNAPSKQNVALHITTVRLFIV